MKSSVVRVIFILSSCLLLLVGIEWSKNFLLISHPVSGNHFLFEGWLQALDVENGIRELQATDSTEIYIVGHRFDPQVEMEVKSDSIIQRKQGVLLLTNSCLILKGDKIPKVNTDKSIELAVELRGAAVDAIYAHFVLVVNGQKVSSFFSSSAMQVYKTSIFFPKGIESISLHYDNDAANQKEGRFLIVKAIHLGDQIIDLNRETVMVTKQTTRRYTGFSSSAQRMKNYMTDLGMDSLRIKTIEFNKSDLNQTLEGARTFKAWPGSVDLQKLNIWTQDIHSRRSWITYQRLLSPGTDVGVLYLQNNEEEMILSKSWWNKLVRITDELFSYMGNWFYLTFLYNE